MAESFMINGHTLDKTLQSEGGKYFAPDASNSNYILLQCKDHLSNQQYKDLAVLKVQFLQYHDVNTYLCRYEPADLNILRSLPFVLSASVFHQDVVINERLKAEFATQPAVTNPSSIDSSKVHSSALKIGDIPKLPVVIVLHPLGDRTPAEVKQHLVKMLQRSPEEITVSDRMIQVTLQGNELDAVAGIDEVQTIERNWPQVPLTNFARRDLKVMEMLQIPDIIPNKLWGNGEIVCVADSGFDIGLQGVNLPPLREMFSETGRSRVSIESTILPTTVRAGTLDSQTADKVGHGTHVCGCVAAWGLYVSPGMTTNIRGIAPSAQIIVQVRESDDETVSSITQQVLDQAHAAGARVHNNSYGLVVNLAKNIPFVPYDNSATVVDNYTAPTTPTNGADKSDMVVVWGAGNSGIKAGRNNQSIGSTALSKNCITVGACESSHNVVMTGKRYTYDQANGTPGNINNIAFFSSRGPVTTLTRMKPDLVAPGTCILSARSKSPVFQALKRKDGVTFAADATGISQDKEWMYSNGTSMSAPLVSGCAAVLRAIIKSKRVSIEPSPRATLIKALLINGATDLNGLPRAQGRGAAAGPIPDPYQGFGRVNMAASVLNITDTVNGGFLEITGIIQGATWQRRINSTPGRNFILRATMVFADRPGPDLQSVLQLRGISRTRTPPPVGSPTPPPKTLYANTNEQFIPDSVNNVQKLVWNGVPSELARLQIEVKAARIISNPDGSAYSQSFAIVWHLEYS